jgi:membrane protein
MPVRYLKVTAKSFLDFFRDGGLMLAAALSYFSIMALVPFCLFLIAIFGYILGSHPEFYAFLSKRLVSFFPEVTGGITKQLGKLIMFRGIGTFGIVLYGILSFQVFSSVETALNTVFEVKKKRHFLWSVVLSLFIVTLLIVVLLISFAAASLLPFLKVVREVFPHFRIGLLTGFLIMYVVPFLMVLLSVSITYIFFPNTRVKARHALGGALFTTVFLEIAKHVFTWYVGTVVEFGTIYGPLTAFVIFLLWAFYSSCIFLIGGEVAHNLTVNGTEVVRNKGRGI